MKVPDGTPSIVPLLFVTIACGAISGFHGMVSSGTSSKQLDKETESRFVGYFGAVGEGLLALGTIIAISAGLRTVAEWEELYSAFGDAGIQSFVQGGGMLMEAGLGLPASLCATVLATMAVLFAATSLDTGFRLMRFVIQEMGERVESQGRQVRRDRRRAGTRHGPHVLAGPGREGGLRIWPLFGTTNQLMASLTLMILAVMLIRKRRNPWPALDPAGARVRHVLLGGDRAALSFAAPGSQDWLLFIIDCVIIVSSVLVAIEGIRAIIRATKEPPEHADEDEKLVAVREEV